MISVVVISKDEPAVDRTLATITAQASVITEDVEVIVVDASSGRLADIARRHPGARWSDYVPPPGVAISIPHQRNVGVSEARGDLIVFIDAGCLPQPGWLERLVAPIRQEGEAVVAGLAVAPAGRRTHYQLEVARLREHSYVDEAPTLNLAFRRDAFDVVGGFDERFEYGSDIDFTWRLREHGFRIRSQPEAVVEHDWGSARRQLRRAYLYGRAKGRLYVKHPSRRSRVWRNDPVVWIYPAFLAGLPLTAVFPLYPFLLLVPAWRARRYGALSVVTDHLAYGLGVLATLAEEVWAR